LHKSNLYEKRHIIAHVNNTQLVANSLQQPPFTRVLLSNKIGPEGFSILVNIIVSPK